MIENLERIKAEGRERISKAPDPDELDKLRVHYLGKKGLLTSLLQQLKDLSPDQRREVGATLNEIKGVFEVALEERQRLLLDGEVQKELEKTPPIDLSLPGTLPQTPGSLHPITRITDQIVQAMRRVGFSLAYGPEIETEEFNFEALNIPAHHPARDMQDTFYIQPPSLLRTHTSPVQIRTMKSIKPPVQVICVGKVYRSDYDQTHTPMFHQVEGLMVDTDVSFADLKGVVQYLTRSLFGNKPIRFRPSFFPFTEPSAEIDMLMGDRWLEIAGCGMIHPNVFRSVGYDPDKYSGFAFGLGIERIAMLKYGIEDLRSFFENDYRMLEQF